jgi:cytidine deaminase
MAEDGTLYTGVNVENAGYSPGICAERCAVAKCISDGHRKLKAVMITSDTTSFTSPCGVCRQTLREFATDMHIMMVTPDLKIEYSSLQALLPMSFGPDDLTMEKK